MTTRSRIAFLVACSAAALGLATAPSFAAGAPAAQSASQHAGKKMSSHHAKSPAGHAQVTKMHKKQVKPGKAAS